MTSQIKLLPRAHPVARAVLPAVLKLCVGAAVCAALMFASAGMADAHEAPTGWAYPFQCCSGYDCREVKSTAVSERPYGYVIAGTGEVLPYSDTRVKDSPDGEFHWCSVAGKNDTMTICLFVPPRAY